MNGYSNEQIKLITKRNTLLFKLLWVFFGVDILLGIIFDRGILTFLLPVGLGVVGVITFFGASQIKPVFSMYLTITGVFALLFGLLLVQPVMVNYLYIWFGLLISTVYNQYKPIIYAGVLALTISTFFFFYDRSLFSEIEVFDIFYINLFTVFLTLFFILSSRFTENLRLRAEDKERSTASQLVETREYFHSIFSHTADAIIVQNLNGEVLAVNRAFVELYGWSEEEVLRGQYQHIPPTQKPLLFDVMKRVQKGESVSGYEMVNQKKSDELFPVSVSFSPIRRNDGTVKAIAGIYRNITEVKRTEELIIQSEKLSVIGQLAAGVAHEIRNPLAILSGFVQFMREEDESNQYTRIMLAEINRMDQILEEYMQLTKVKQHPYQKINVCELLMETLMLMEGYASLSNIYLNYDRTQGDHGNCHVNGDSNSLKQVFINLLKNAVEASTPGNKVSISMSMEKSSFITIDIKDDGEGIPESELKRLGEPFYTTKDTGTGLGLMVSFKIIEQHSGEITVTSEPGKGTVFSVKLPKIKEESS